MGKDKLRYITVRCFALRGENQKKHYGIAYSKRRDELRYRSRLPQSSLGDFWKNCHTLEEN